MHEIINKNSFPRDFKESLRATGILIQGSLQKIAVIENKFSLQINNEISVWLIAALALKGVIYGTEFLDYIIT